MLKMSKYDVKIIIRKIGQPININDTHAEIDEWWKNSD